MSKFHTIEIADLVALHPHVEISKFLGFFEHVFYQPTHSNIESYRNYYAKTDANTLADIAEAEHPTQLMEQVSEMHTSTSNDYRLDLCMSADHQFAAFQVFARKQDAYVPYSKLCFLEGNCAAQFENLLA